MKLYLDTGNIHEIREVAELGLLDGVTTNPTLIAKENKNFEEELKIILSILKKHSKSDFTVSAEVTDLSSLNAIIEQGKKLAKIDKHIVIKIPLTEIGLKAVSILSKKNIRCNVTLCFSVAQSLLAAKAGAWCVSPFIGRIDDEGYEGLTLVKDIKEVYENYGFKTKILAASIRSSHDVYECMKIGVDITTIPFKIFKQLYYNPLTDIGIEKFNKDWKEYKRTVEK